jgi:DNA-binding transcriptional LysR family regulator
LDNNVLQKVPFFHSGIGLADSGVNPRKLDQRFELGSNEAIKSLVIGGLGVGFFSCWDIQKEICYGTRPTD